jgi:hypothetical protein
MSVLGRLPAVLLLTCAAGAADAGDKPGAAPPLPPTVTQTSTDGRFTIDLPADWTLDRVPTDLSVVMAWRARLPGEAGTVELRVIHYAGHPNARAQAYTDRQLERRDRPTAGPATVELGPVPRMGFDVGEGEGVVHLAWAYRVFRRNSVTLQTSCHARVWPMASAACLRAAASITAKLDETPTPPTGYRVLPLDGWSYRTPTGAKDADVEAARKQLRELEGEFAKSFGRVPSTEDTPFIVYVHARAAEAAQADDAASKARSGAFFNVATSRLFVVPTVKGDAVAAGDFAREAWRAFLAQTFGEEAPLWLRHGDAELVAAERECGRSLPSLPAETHAALPATLRRFDELCALQGAQSADRAEMLVYAALFREGGKPWRDAFAAFAKDCAADGDCATAQQKRLLSLDQEKLRAAAQAYLKEMRPVKAK